MRFIQSARWELDKWPSNIKLFFLANILYQIGTGMFGVLYNLYIQELGYGDAMNGRVVSIQSLATALLFVPIGIWGDRASRRKILIIGALFSGAAFLLRSFMSGEASLIGLAVFTGLFASFFQVLSIPFLAENVKPKERLRMFSYFSSLVLASQVIGSMGGGLLADALQASGLSTLASLQTVLALGGGATFAAFLPMLFVREHRTAGLDATPAPVSAQAAATGRSSSYSSSGNGISAGENQRIDSSKVYSAETAASAVSDTGAGPAKADPAKADPSKAAQTAAEFKTIGKFVLAQLLIGFGSGLVVPYLNLYFTNRFSASLSLMGILISLGQIMTIVSMLIGPTLARKVGQVKAVVIFQMLSLPFLLLTGFTHWFAVAAISFLFRQALMNAANPIQSSIMIDRVADNRRGIANSLTQTAFMLGWATMGPVQAKLVTGYGSYWGYAITFSITGCLYIAASLMYFFMFRKSSPAIAQKAAGL